MSPYAAISVRVGSALLAAGAFVALTHELAAREVDALDRTLLSLVASARRAWLNGAAVDVTALGSPTLLATGTIIVIVALFLVRRRAAALQLFTASTGAALLTTVVKHAVERQRPLVVLRLVTVSGFSYPSGHTLAASAIYLTVALIVARELPGTRAVALAVGAVLVAAIGLSRVYLGVHYPSDVVSGVFLGAGWALVVDAVAVAGSARGGRRRASRVAPRLALRRTPRHPSRRCPGARYQLATSDGLVLVAAGSVPPSPSLRPHPRLGRGPLVLVPADREFAAVAGLHAALVAAGAHQAPDAVERATPRYAAAYFTARLLGQLEFTPDDAAVDSVWPWPGVGRGAGAVAEQLCTPIPTLPWCCGPCDCSRGPSQDQASCAPMDPGSVDDWWCAAGDHCNAFHLWMNYPGGDCGTAWMFNQPNNPLSGLVPEHTFHHDSSILHFVGCDCDKPGQLCCDWHSAVGPTKYCAAPLAAVGRWTTAPHNEPPPPSCTCVASDGPLCGAALGAWAQARGCVVPFSLGNGDAYECRDGAWALATRCAAACAAGDLCCQSGGCGC